MQIEIGQHLINRLKEINIDTIFGVPGDYNMVILMTFICIIALVLIIFITLASFGYHRR
jgi:TPP-dependent 2-oxoacid decarboxylase